MTTTAVIPLDKISAHPDNPRRDAVADDEMVDSIKAQGVLQDVGVVEADGKYLLIWGHRRLDGARKAELTSVTAKVLDHLTTRASQIEAMLVENGQRVDLSAVEEGAAYQQLVLEGVSEAEIATTTGRSAKTVKQRLSLTRLPEEASEALHSHQISITQAEGLVELEAHPDLLKSALEQLGQDNFEYVIRRSVNRVKNLETEAKLRDEYIATGLPEIKQPKDGWDYSKGPRPAREDEEPDAYWAGGSQEWDSAPKLIVSKIAGSEKTPEQLKADEQWAKQKAKAEKAAEEAGLARRMRLEHVAELARALKVPAAFAPHMRTGVARIVAGLTAEELELVIEVSGADLERAKNDYHNDQIASQVLTLSSDKLLSVFGAALALQATSHLHLGYGGTTSETVLTNANTYWDSFDTSKYDLPKVDKAHRAELKKKLTAAIAADAKKAQA